MKLRDSWKLAPVMLTAFGLLSACGKEHFQKPIYSASAVAAQYNYIRPKLDVVLFQDKSESMIAPTAALKPQLQAFLSGLDSNWDYRFIVLPLQTTQNLSSKYVVAANCTGINASRCLSPSQISSFNSATGDSGWINSIDGAIGSTDYGFFNMAQNINNMISQGFVRSDAVLATIVVSNGEDVSGGVGYYDRGDGVQLIDYNSSTTQNSFTQYVNWFKSLKSAYTLSRFYAAVSAQRYTSCYGGSTYQGKRYMDMAGALGGMSMDLCNGQLGNALNDFRNQMKTIVQVIAFDYVVLPDEPTGTITVMKNGATLDSRYWRYVGYKANQATSYSPASGNIRSGYMIQLLNGMDFKGSDQISVDYQKK